MTASPMPPHHDREEANLAEWQAARRRLRRLERRRQRRDRITAIVTRALWFVGLAVLVSGLIGLVYMLGVGT